MRTTIRLNDELLTRAKQAAAGSGRTLTAVIEDALRESLARQKTSVKMPISLPSSGEGGVRPGVNLDSMVEMLDVMDEV